MPHLGVDFVLYIKDDKANEPSVLSYTNKLGEQALIVSILPDLRAPKFKDRTLKCLVKGQVDTDRDAVYDPQMTEDEEEESDEIVELEPKLYEYIFLIDRSGSMSGSPIKLAVEALKLFLHSLPMGSKFNIVSYGSDFSTLF
jgi:hypothetical protein